VARVALLRNVLFISTVLQVYVLSTGGWSWVVAWGQIGVSSVSCVAATEEAARELKELQTHPVLGKAITVEQLEKVRECLEATPHAILCCHLGDSTALSDWFRPQLASMTNSYFTLITTPAGRVYPRLHDPYLGPHFRWNEIRHRAMGGLTSAKLRIGWKGPRELPQDMEPGRKRLPIRPLDRFLEPSVRLGAWRRPGNSKTGVWAPARNDATAFPWPWAAQPPWVEAPSCFLGGGMVERPLTDKERAQLVDLREDWAPTLLDVLWYGNKGKNPPLRMLAEAALGVVPWVHNTTSWVLDEDFKIEQADWGRTRPPWVRDGGGDADFLGWNWAADALGEARVATKADDAEVDLSLWAVGGDEPGMEEARATLRGFLLRSWKRRLTREVTSWLRTNATEGEHQANIEAARDCLQRCANSAWWDWADGSRLMFWRWPLGWRAEARDGARGNHIGSPRPRRFFPPIPISEEWIIEKDLEKLEKLLRRRYVIPGAFRVAVPRFPVPKGTDDIRVVWDLAKNGLNAAMSTPSFFLPTMGTRSIQTLTTLPR
jgi:hypothetical protein